MHHFVNGRSSRLNLWSHVREFAVPPSMIESSTARRESGDWAGACAAARVDVDLDLRVVSRARGRPLAQALRADLRHLAPDLLRWHFPRVGPDGLLRPGLTVSLARYADDEVHLVARTPPAWAAAGQRISLAVWAPSGVLAGAGGHPHPRPDRRFRLDLHRHLWDARRTAELTERGGSGGDPGGRALDRWGEEAALLVRADGVEGSSVAVRLGSRKWVVLDGSGCGATDAEPPGPQDRVQPRHHDSGCGATDSGPLGPRDRAEASRDNSGCAAPNPEPLGPQHRIQPRRDDSGRGATDSEPPDPRHRAEPRRDSSGCAAPNPEPLASRGTPATSRPALPILPDAATWTPPDLDLVRAGLITADRLHPLVASALIPPEPRPAPTGNPYSTTSSRLVDCRGATHEIGVVGGVLVPLDHSPDEIRREELLVALGGNGLPCLRAIDAAHRHPEDLPDVRARLAHGDVAGALAVVEGLLGPDALLRTGPLRDALETAARRKVVHGLYRAGLVQGPAPSTEERRRQRAAVR
ncbi:hypothetical protein [Lentzea albida]|uniref:Uncharacterized protein n=1 Tax=Lentzea albida TaxID=65499 RepID=A0A1H9MUL2_9PSEU|nr:hypothetical protein [Lentzea albida]SER27372.1 hypothetical protein SAMN04488000_107228 [Lentzea albida]